MVVADFMRPKAGGENAKAPLSLSTLMKRTIEMLAEETGQLLIMGFDGTEPTAKLRSMLSAIQPGGVVLFARNIIEPQQTWEFLRECEKCVRAPLFCCVDMEGGTVDRLKNAVGPAPSAAEVFASANRKLFRLHGRVIGEEVRALGFNVDFAPVCDLALAPSRNVLGSRAVSPDPNDIVVYAWEFLRGLRDVKVLGCGKHFPGLGEGSLDTHKNIAGIEKSFKSLWNEDIVPYRELHKQMPFIMVSHADYPQVAEGPASLSRKWVANVLRKKIRYEGVIVSDDLEMGAALQAASEVCGQPAGSPECAGAAALATIKAGADIYLVCHKAENVLASFETVLRAAERDRRVAARVEESAKRVLALKRRAALAKRRCPAPTQPIVDKLRRALWQLGEEVRLAKL